VTVTEILQLLILSFVMEWIHYSESDSLC